MKDLVIGAADLYNWSNIKIWAKSLRASGFDGDVVLLGYRIDDDIIDECTKLNIDVYKIDHDEFGRPINHHAHGLPTQSHKLRSFHMWQYLKTSPQYRFVIVTDTRDVVFQYNPTTFLNELINIYSSEHTHIFLPSENVPLIHEPWNHRMVEQLFGPYLIDGCFNQHMSSINSGTFFGYHGDMITVLLNMFLISKNFNVTGSDQPTLNILHRHHMISHSAVLEHNDGWACQCGTVLDTSKPELLQINYTDPPIIKSDGLVYTPTDKLFCVVHQYDRIPSLNKIIQDRYA